MIWSQYFLKYRALRTYQLARYMSVINILSFIHSMCPYHLNIPIFIFLTTFSFKPHRSCSAFYHITAYYIFIWGPSYHFIYCVFKDALLPIFFQESEQECITNKTRHFWDNLFDFAHNRRPVILIRFSWGTDMIFLEYCNIKEIGHFQLGIVYYFPLWI